MIDQFDVGLPSDRALSLGKLLLSPDGRTLYVGSGRRDLGTVQADQVSVIDSHQGTKIASFSTSESFGSWSLGPGGTKIYATDPDKGTVIVIDANEFRQAAILPGIGLSPWEAVVPPLAVDAGTQSASS